MKPKKIREVSLPPKVVFFKPQGIPLREAEIIYLTIDEYEALRLADYKKLNHYESSKMMNISRPTFTRLLESAHNKISSAIVEGKAIRIEGGEFKFSGRVFKCNNCGQFQIIDDKNENQINLNNKYHFKEDVEGNEDENIKEINDEDKKIEICSNCNSKDLTEISADSFRRFRRGKWRNKP